MPVTEAEVRKLRVDDTRDPGSHAVRHPRRDADPHVRPRPHDALRPARPRRHPYRAQRAQGRNERRSIRPATRRSASAPRPRDRMERFTRPLMERETAYASSSARAACGEGSRARSANWAASISRSIGGTAALETTWIEQIEDVDLDDLNPESLCEVPHQGIRPAAGGDGQPRRQPLHGGERQGSGTAAGGAGEARPPGEGARA